MSKRISYLYMFVALICFVLVNIEGSVESMKSIMEAHQVVPDLIDEAPELSLKVIYEDGVIVKHDVELKPIQVKNQPMVMWDPEPGTFYTLMVVSPDAPSRATPTSRDLQSWVVVNIPGNDISNGETLAEFIGVGPPLETGLHRYVFLLFRQMERMEFDEEKIPKTTIKGRIHFSTRKFIEKYNLGMPLAGNMFEAQYDDYVPEVHKQISWSYNA